MVSKCARCTSKKARKIARELYVAITLDREILALDALMASTWKAAWTSRKSPSAIRRKSIFRESIDPLTGFRASQARRIAAAARSHRQANGAGRDRAAGLVQNLHRDFDAAMVEVNPLIVTADGT